MFQEKRIFELLPHRHRPENGRGFIKKGPSSATKGPLCVYGTYSGPTIMQPDGAETTNYP